MNWLLRKIEEMCVIFLYVVVYLVVGIILAIPYTILASGTLSDFVATAIVIPVPAAIVYIVFGLWRYMHRAMSWRLKLVPVLVVGWFLLPVLLNGISILFGRIGHPTIAHYAFVIRYAAPWYILPGATAILLIVELICFFKDSFRKIFPSSGNPPMNGPDMTSGLRQRKISPSQDTDMPMLRLSPA